MTLQTGGVQTRATGNGNMQAQMYSKLTNLDKDSIILS